jgi:DNA repair protein RecO (recombination protein O)
MRNEQFRACFNLNASAAYYVAMKSKTEAIIISSMNLGEADKLVTFFSVDRGIQKGVAKNARKSFRRFGAGLEAFTTCRLHLYEREHQELVRIESIDIINQPADICRDLNRTAAGSVMLELVKELAPPGECNTAAFYLLAQVIELLNAGEDPVFLLRIFEIRLLSVLGYQPKLDYCLSCGKQPKWDVIFHSMKGGVLCRECMISSEEPLLIISQGAVGFYYQALRMDLDKISRLKPSAGIMRELSQVFSAHIIHILGKKLKSAEFLRSVCTL